MVILSFSRLDRSIYICFDKIIRPRYIFNQSTGHNGQQEGHNGRSKGSFY